jgi:hypothetical protein
MPPKKVEQGFFGALFRKPVLTGDAGTVAFEARLPNPPIIVATEAIPLTLLLKRVAGVEGVVYIRSVRILLGMTTYIAAQGFRRDLGYLLPILDSGPLNMSLPIGKKELVIHPGDLIQESSLKAKGIALPDTIPPSFRTCNIARKYALVLEIGVSSYYNSLPESIQLTVDVEIFSGFKPPAELLAAMHPDQQPPPPPTTNEKANAELGTKELPTYDEAVGNTVADNPSESSGSGRGHFEVEAQHLRGVESWDDEKK